MRLYEFTGNSQANNSGCEDIIKQFNSKSARFKGWAYADSEKHEN